MALNLPPSMCLEPSLELNFRISRCFYVKTKKLYNEAFMSTQFFAAIFLNATQYQTIYNTSKKQLGQIIDVGGQTPRIEDEVAHKKRLDENSAGLTYVRMTINIHFHLKAENQSLLFQPNFNNLCFYFLFWIFGSLGFHQYLNTLVVARQTIFIYLIIFQRIFSISGEFRNPIFIKTCSFFLSRFSACSLRYTSIVKNDNVIYVSLIINIFSTLQAEERH